MHETADAVLDYDASPIPLLELLGSLEGSEPLKLFGVLGDRHVLFAFGYRAGEWLEQRYDISNRVAAWFGDLAQLALLITAA